MTTFLQSILILFSKSVNLVYKKSTYFPHELINYPW